MSAPHHHRAISTILALVLLAGACSSETSTDTATPLPLEAPLGEAVPHAEERDTAPDPTSTAAPTVEPTAAPAPTEPPTTEPTAATNTTFNAADYPPEAEADIAAIFNPLVEQYGLRFTYGNLIDRTANGTFRSSPTGDHLALYVEPIGDYTDTEYIDNTWVLAQLTPWVFETWPALESWDFCQEPRPEENSEARPPPVTQLDIFRAHADEIDWENGSLIDLILASQEEPTTALRIDPRLQQQPAFVAELQKLSD